MTYGILSDVMLAFIFAACATGLIAGIWLIWKGLSGILKD